MTYLDWIIVGILVLSTGIAYKRGLVKTLFGLCSTLVGVFLAYLIYPLLSAWIMNNTKFYGLIQDKVTNALDLSAATNIASPQDKIQVIEALKLPGFMKNILLHNNNAEVYKLLGADNISDYIINAVSKLVLNGIVFIAVVLIVIIIIKIISGFLDIMTKLPVVKQLNKLGGLILGAAWGLLLVFIFCIALSYISSVQKDGKLLNVMEDSKVLEFFSNHNLVMDRLDEIVDGKTGL